MTQYNNVHNAQKIVQQQPIATKQSELSTHGIKTHCNVKPQLALNAAKDTHPLRHEHCQ